MISPLLTYLLILLIVGGYSIFLKSIYAAIVFFASITLILWLPGYYRFIYYKKYNPNKVKSSKKSIFKIFSVFEPNYKNIRVEKSDYQFLLMGVYVFISMFFLACKSFNDLPIVQSHLKYKSANIALLICSIIFIIRGLRDWIVYFKLRFDKDAVFLVLNGFDVVKIIKSKEFKEHHKHIYLMEIYEYKDYSLIDLQREKFYLEGELELQKKPAFFDVYILPLVIALSTGFLTLISMYINQFLFRDGSYDILGYALGAYFLFASLVFLVVANFTYMSRKAPHTSIKNLKTRILVVEYLMQKLEKYDTMRAIQK